MGADAQHHQMKTKTPLIEVALRNPIEYANQGFTRHGKGLGSIRLPIKMAC